MPPRLPRQLRAVIVVNRPERSDDCDVIRTGADILEPIPNWKTALTVDLVPGLQRHDLLSISMPRIATDDVLFRAHQNVFERRLIDRLIGVCIQRGFDVET